MTKKLLDYRDVLKEELKDKEFSKYYQEEGQKLAVGYKIAKLRHQLGLTQTQLARKIHTTQTVISRLESGDYWTCSLRTLEKIALVTGSELEVSFKFK
ncbi:MAG: helix-turn-helix transcriptional regulator [Elusimicrobiota bacterium]